MKMLTYFYSMVTPWAVANNYQILKNRVLGEVANYIYPIYCKIKPIKATKMHENGDEEIVVSLTSFPARIEKVHLCINSLLRQSFPPDRVILWLAESQFPDGKGVPKRLLDLQRFGLEIRFCDDIRSYKKIFYAAQEFCNSIIVTVDDDTLYPENWLYELAKTSREYPNVVCCYRAHKMTMDNGKFAPYANWIGLSPNEKGPSKMLIPVGVGGVLYPSGYFNNVDFDIEIIKKLCPTTDDIWLKMVGLMNGYSAVKVQENSKEWFTIKSSQNQSLMQSNVGENINDIAVKNLVEYYGIQEKLMESNEFGLQE